MRVPNHSRQRSLENESRGEQNGIFALVVIEYRAEFGGAVDRGCWCAVRGVFGIAAGIDFGIEQHNFDTRITPANGLAQLLSVKVGQATIKKEDLPVAALQVVEGFSSTAGLLEAAHRRTQTF
ncbi:MAG: hypothetical protein WAK23_11580 [Terriglobales bacterium]